MEFQIIIIIIKQVQHYMSGNVCLQGASTTCYVALSPKIEGVSGKYFADCNETKCSRLANDELEAQKLWNNTHALLHKRLHQATI